MHANRGGVGLNEEKVEAIRNQQTPTTQTEVRRFLGFVNYYSIFILNYLKYTSVLTALIGKGTLFTQGDEQEASFQKVKEKYYASLVLAYQDLTLPTFLETDYSRFAIGAALIQERDGVRQLVGFYSKKLNKAEINYDIYNKEILAIISTLKFQKLKLKGYSPFIILTDYKNLEYFIVKRQLSKRQIQQFKLLSQFQFSLVYRLGIKAVILDALLQREQDTLGKSNKDSRFRRFLELDNISTQLVSKIEGGGVATTNDFLVLSLRIVATQLDKVLKEAALNKTEIGGPFQDNDINRLQDKTVKKDTIYQSAIRAV